MGKCLVTIKASLGSFHKSSCDGSEGDILRVFLPSPTKNY